MCGKSLIVTSHAWACKVLLPLLLWAPGMKRLIYFQNFVQIVWLLESNNCNATTNDLKPKKTYQWTLWINMVTNGMVLHKLQHFVMRLAGILTDLYYKELIEISAKPAFLFGTRPNMWGILASKFLKVDFCHCGPYLRALLLAVQPFTTGTYYLLTNK